MCPAMPSSPPEHTYLLEGRRRLEHGHGLGALGQLGQQAGVGEDGEHDGAAQDVAGVRADLLGARSGTGGSSGRMVGGRGGAAWVGSQRRPHAPQASRRPADARAPALTESALTQFLRTCANFTRPSSHAAKQSAVLPVNSSLPHTMICERGRGHEGPEQSLSSNGEHDASPRAGKARSSSQQGSPAAAAAGAPAAAQRGSRSLR